MMSKRQSGTIGLVGAVVSLPRLPRILLVAAVSLAVTLALSPLIDEVYFQLAFTPLSSLSLPVARVLPALITAALGLGMYTIGWWLIVGTVGEHPQARQAVLWYIAAGMLAALVVALLIMRGISLLNFVNS